MVLSLRETSVDAPPLPVFYCISDTMNKQLKQPLGFGGLEMLCLFKMQELFSWRRKFSFMFLHFRAMVTCFWMFVLISS